MAIASNEWRDAGREAKLALVLAAHDRQPIVWVTTEILVHSLNASAVDALAMAKVDPTVLESPLGNPCPCCQSRTCHISERIPDLSLYIDRISGKRVLPARLTAEQRVAVEAVAERVHIPIRVSQLQLPLLYRSGRRADLVSGAMRSGKSQVLGYAFCREWILRGGRMSNLWLVAPSREMVYALLQKMVYGDDTAPPILPAVLFTYLPTSQHQPRARMIDGSVLSLKHLKSKQGTNLKAEAAQVVLVDEAGEMSDRAQLNNLEGRVHTTGGRLMLCTTPTRNHWLRELVRDPCVAWVRMLEEEREKLPTHAAHYWRYSSLGMDINPWIDPVHTWRKMLAQGGEDDPAVQREYKGIWSGAAGPLHRGFHLDAHIMENEFRSLQEWDTMRKRDITASVSRKMFGGYNPKYPGLRAQNHSYIAGMDVNCRPHSTLLCQVAADPEDPTNKDKWTLVVWDVHTTHQDASVHAQTLYGKQFSKMVRRESDGETYRNIGIICDGKSVSWDPTAHRHGGDPHGLAQLFGAKGFDVRAPCYTNKGKPTHAPPADSYRLVSRLLRENRLLIHARCEPLRQALLEQEDSGDGVMPVKVSGNASDRISSTIDALRYLAWGVFHGGPAVVKLVSGGTGMLR